MVQCSTPLIRQCMAPLAPSRFLSNPGFALDNKPTRGKWRKWCRCQKVLYFTNMADSSIKNELEFYKNWFSVIFVTET